MQSAQAELASLKESASSDTVAVAAAEGKLAEAEGKLAEAEGKLAEAKGELPNPLCKYLQKRLSCFSPRP